MSDILHTFSLFTQLRLPQGTGTNNTPEFKTLYRNNSRTISRTFRRKQNRLQTQLVLITLLSEKTTQDSTAPINAQQLHEKSIVPNCTLQIKIDFHQHINLRTFQGQPVIFT